MFALFVCLFVCLFSSVKIAYWYLSLCVIIHRVVRFLGEKKAFLQRKKIDCIFLVP